jgi:hypothetical protein
MLQREGRLPRKRFHLQQRLVILPLQSVSFPPGVPFPSPPPSPPPTPFSPSIDPVPTALTVALVALRIFVVVGPIVSLRLLCGSHGRHSAYQKLVILLVIVIVILT